MSAYPLFCMAEAADGVHLEPAPALKLVSFLACVAGQLANLPDGAKVTYKFVDTA